MRKVIATIAVCIILISGHSFAGQRTTTDDISLLNQYYYRLANRAAAIDPGKRYSGNFKPLSIRESVNLFDQRESLQFLEERTRRYYSTEEHKKQPGNFVFKPFKEMHAFGAYTAQEDARLYGKFGPQVDGNYYGALIGGGNAYLKDWLVGSYSLRVSNDELDGPVDFFGYKLKIGFKHVSIAAAKESVVVGPGFFGNYLVSDNVKPENSIILKTEVPYDWGFLGAFRWYVWHTWYDDDERTNRDPRVLGARVSLMPWDVLELGLNRTSLYGGSENGSFNTLEAYWEIFTAKNENVMSSEYNTQQQASVDATLYLPILNKIKPFQGGKMYLDYAFNDFKAFWQSEDGDSAFPKPLGESLLMGMLLTTGKTDIIGEYVDINRQAYKGGASGFNHMGYSDNGYVLGHFAGNDTKGFIAEVYHEWLAAFHTYVGGLYLDHEDEAKKNSNTADAHQIEKGIFGGLRFVINDSLQIDFSCQYSEYSKTDTNESPAGYAFIDEEYSNTIVSISMDYHF